MKLTPTKVKCMRDKIDNVAFCVGVFIFTLLAFAVVLGSTVTPVHLLTIPAIFGLTIKIIGESVVGFLIWTEKED